MRRRPQFVLAAIAAAMLAWTGSIAAQPSPPIRFYGSLTIDTLPAPLGSAVRGFINEKDCTTANVFTAQAGQYAVEVAGASQTPGCGVDGAVIVFRVNGRDASPTGTFQTGQFQRLDLSVSAAPPPTPAPTPVPAPVPNPAPNPVPSPTPGGQFSVARLDLKSPCVPAEGIERCDTARALLWTGDVSAWQAEAIRRGLPRPGVDEVKNLAFDLRVAANDPASVQQLAKTNGWPKLYISALRFKGLVEGDADEYIEILNVGGGDQDMTGWRARAVETGVDFFFTDGTILSAGASCRFYTNQIRDDSCPGSINVASSGVWADDIGSAELWYDPLALLADATRYSADPATQPQPPNIQGTNAPAG